MPRFVKQVCVDSARSADPSSFPSGRHVSRTVMKRLASGRRMFTRCTLPRSSCRGSSTSVCIDSARSADPSSFLLGEDTRHAVMKRGVGPAHARLPSGRRSAFGLVSIRAYRYADVWDPENVGSSGLPRLRRPSPLVMPSSATGTRAPWRLAGARLSSGPCTGPGRGQCAGTGRSRGPPGSGAGGPGRDRPTRPRTCRPRPRRSVGA